MRTEPDVAVNAPSNNCNSVVLPEPFNPITATRLLSGVIVNDVGFKPTLPSSYVWPAWSSVNVTSCATSGRLDENNESKNPCCPFYGRAEPAAYETGTETQTPTRSSDSSPVKIRECLRVRRNRIPRNRTCTRDRCMRCSTSYGTAPTDRHPRRTGRTGPSCPNR